MADFETAAAGASPAVLNVRVLYEGWGSYKLGLFRLPSGDTVSREFEDHGDGVAVLAYDPERRCALLVRQFRPPAFVAAGEPQLLEALAGLLDENDPEACARREALEEAGLRLATLEKVVTGLSMPGISTERLHLFLAPYAAADRVAAGGGLASEHEHITVVELPLHELAARADAGGITDMKTLVLVLALRLRRPELFRGPR